jgi:dolichyl-phosphate beta-glucosyltransferase
MASQEGGSTREPTALYRAVRLVCRHAVWIALFSLPAIVLWWHVWTGHPSSTLTCACGDPAQEVWFIAWPAWALAHGANVFFSGAVNVPYGANLLSNTSGTLIGLVLSPVTWLWGPVVATNVALTLAPAVSAWGCWLAVRSFVTWKPAAIPAALVYGYSSAIVTSLIFGHVSVTVLVIPPLLFSTLLRIVVLQDRSPWLDGLTLAALVTIQFLISPEVLVMCALLSGIGLVVVAAAGWRGVAGRLRHAASSLAIGVGLSALVLAYPAWDGLHGPQSVSGVLFSIAPLSGVILSGFYSPGPYGQFADSYVRFGGYYGRIGPPPNYVGWGVDLSALGAMVLGYRRPLTWFVFFIGLVTSWLALGYLLIGGPPALAHIWLPWHLLGQLPVLQEILPDQLAPFIALAFAFLVALGLDAASLRLGRLSGWSPSRSRLVCGLLTAAVAVICLVPVFYTFDMPLTVQPTRIPVWMSEDATRLPDRSVLLTVPFAVSGSTPPMLWQAVDDMHFDLAGAGLKTPNAHGGPVDQGTPGSARRIMSDLTIYGNPQPSGTSAQLAAVRRAIRTWHVSDVVIDGQSRDPIYASGFLTAALGQAPTYIDYAWVWKIPAGGPTAPAITGVSLPACRSGATQQAPLAMAQCVLGSGPAS